MKQQQKKSTRIVIGLVSLSAVGIFAVSEIAPLLIDREAIKHAIEVGLNESTGVHFSIQELNLHPTLFQGIQVNLNTSQIRDLRNHPLGHINNITIQLRYWPLLFQRTPEIAKIHLNHVRIPVGEYNLFKTIKLKLVPPKETGFIKPAKMHDTEVLLSDYLIEDVQMGKSVQTLFSGASRFRIEGQDLSIRHLEASKPISITGNGRLAYLIQPSGQKAIGNSMQTYRFGQYKVFTEIPQAAVKQGKVTAEALGRLDLVLDGPDLQLNLNYQLGQNHNAAGSLRNSRLDLRKAQTLALQLGNTLGLQLPEALSDYYLNGVVQLDQEFKVKFIDGIPELEAVNGLSQITEMTASPVSMGPTPLVRKVNGQIRFRDQVIETNRLSFQSQGLPFALKGQYQLDNQAVDAWLFSEPIHLSEIQRTLTSFKQDSSFLQGKNAGGTANFRAHVTGTVKNPSYQGLLLVDDASLDVPSQGLSLSHMSGKVQFSGAGLEKPKLSYQGQLAVQDGRLVSKTQGVFINHYTGKVAFNGQWLASSRAAILPDLKGDIQIQDARYQDPKSGLSVDGIRGVIGLANQRIHLERFRGLFAGSEFLAGGTIQLNLKKPLASLYDMRLSGQHIDLPRLRREVLPQVSQARVFLAQINPNSGYANLNLNLTTGLNLNGRLDVSGLAMKTPQEGYPLRVPRLALLFNNEKVTVPTATIYYGAIPVELSGLFQRPGTYRLKFAASAIPVESLREHQKLLEKLSDVNLPEIWNTSGSMGFTGSLSNQSTQISMAFQNAGLSWQGGDLPLYGLNGSLLYQQAGKARPVVSSQGLQARYGNSPVLVKVNTQENMIVAQVEGTVSSITLNHYLVSHQSNATPYRNTPFHAILQTIPVTRSSAGSRKKVLADEILAEMYLDLSQNFKEAYADVAKPKKSAETQKTKPDSAKDDATGSNILKRVVGLETPLGKKLITRLNPIRTAGTLLDVTTKTVSAGFTTLSQPSAQSQPSEKTSNRQPSQSEQAAETSQPGNTQSRSASEPDQNEAVPTQMVPVPVASKSNLALIPEKTEGTAYLDMRVRLSQDTLDVENLVLHLFQGGELYAQGRMSSPLGENPGPYQFQVFTAPELNLKPISQGASENDFFKGASGKIATNLQILGTHPASPSLNGWLNLDQVKVPYLTVQELTGKGFFQGEKATLDIDHFKIPGLDTALTGNAVNLFEAPVTLENMNIDGSLLSIESLTSFNNDIIKPIIVDQLGHNFLKPWQQGDPTSPVQFKDANVHFKEAIYQNILMNNLTSRLSVYANSFTELTNTRLEAAGGQVHGYLSMSPNDRNFTSLELNAENVKANALTQALLNVSNQIFGDLIGTVRFTTYGQTDQEMQQNANGTVSIKVTNGRLPAIAKVETLLATANVIRGGLLGFNLNNLFRSLAFRDSNYFGKFTGDMLITNQVLYTENLLSDGVNLDLLIQGSLRMDNGAADMLVNGQMSQNVAGRLGLLGQLSLGSVVRYVPALGNFGKNAGLLEYLPGVGYVPGLGGGPSGKFNRFQVRLDGPMDEPRSVRSFQWLKK